MHRWLLAGAGGLLTTTETAENVTYVWSIEDEIRADGRYDVAAEWLRESPGRRALLVGQHLYPPMRIGVETSFQDRARCALVERGIDEVSIELIPGDAMTDWQQAELLGRWLRQHPDAEVMVLCDRFATRYLRRVFNAKLGHALAARLRIRGLPGDGFDEANWWRSRHGVKEFMGAWLRLAHAVCLGEAELADALWDPDAYERELLSSSCHGK